MARAWRMRPHPDEQTLRALQTRGIDAILARVLAVRNAEGIDSSATDALDEILDPKIKRTMPNPSRLADMDKATERLARALQEQQTLGIITDYDVDGAASASLLLEFWTAMGGKACYVIPERESQGYGPNSDLFRQLREQGADRLVATLDCGSSAGQALQQAQREGTDVIVLDHHELEQPQPPCYALVSPQRTDNRVDLRSLCAAGVVFLLLVALKRRLGASVDLRNCLDRVALATVCDCVPLSPLNRAFVRYGLALLSRARHEGLAALSRERRSPPFSARDLSFFFGPRLNACGRMGDARLAVELLLCNENAHRARDLAQAIESLNTQRIEQQTACLEEAMPIAVEQRRSSASRACVLGSAQWPISLLGIVASRLAEQVRRPTFVLHYAEATARGSARLPDCDESNNLAALVQQAKAQGQLLTGGGHARACGFSLLCEKEDAFVAFLEANLTPPQSTQPQGWIDAEIAPSAVSEDLCFALARLSPFGQDNPAPIFLFKDVSVFSCRRMGARGDHIACRFATSSNERLVDGIAFFTEDSGFSEILEQAQHDHRKLSIVGEIQCDSYSNRRRVQVLIKDCGALTIFYN